MLRILFATVSLEATLILSMVFKTPARKAVILGLDKIKRGHGPIVAKSIAGTVFAILISSLNSAYKMWTRKLHDGNVNTTDQILLAKHLLEASLMGFFLFLALLTDRLHYYIRELHMRRRSDSTRKHDSRFGGFEEAKAREEQVDTFKDIVRQLGSELDTKGEELVTADTKIDALKKQTQVMLLEYDRVLSQNQQFRSRLLLLDQQLSRQK